MALPNIKPLDPADGQRLAETRRPGVSLDMSSVQRTLDILDATLSSIQTAQDIHKADLTELKDSLARIESALIDQHALGECFDLVLKAIHRFETRQIALERAFENDAASQKSYSITSKLVILLLVVAGVYFFSPDGFIEGIRAHIQPCLSDTTKCWSSLFASR